MKTHELKILPRYFKAVREGVKTFELRKDDRSFDVGDYIDLYEYDGKKYTGKRVLMKVVYKLDNIDGLDKNYCILGIQ